MATSGTFTSERYGDQYGPWLSLAWSRIDVDEADNRSRLRLTLTLHSDRALYFSASKTGQVEGSSFTHTTGFSGTGTKTLRVIEMWVNHNSDGSMSKALDASFNLSINWSGNNIGTMSVSGTAVLDAIPRASDFTAFTLSNPTLNTSTATTINYTISRKSSAFTHDMELRYGDKVIASWTATTGSLTRTLSAAEVNTIIQQMSSHVSGSLRLYMQTKSGSTRIGDEKYINEGISLNTAIKPTASAPTYYITGSGRDKTIGKYVQNISKVTASFTTNPGYGATAKLSKITVYRQSDGLSKQTISGTSGTVGSPFSRSGVFVIECYSEDSRGRSATSTATFTVDAYSPPNVSKFTVARQIAATSNVDLSTIGTWSPLDTSNPASILITSVDPAGVTTTIHTTPSSTTGAFSLNQVLTAQADSKSYVYLIKITDSFGMVASADGAVGTSFMEFTIRRGMGIGVGKVHQKGALDVKGDIYMEGRMRIGNYALLNEDLANPRGIEVNEGIYIRNGYLDLNSYDEAVYGVGRMQSYYIANQKKLKMFGRDANYINHSIDLDLDVGGNLGQVLQGPWVAVTSMSNGWQNYNTAAGSYVRLSYRKTTHGTVQIFGFIRNGTAPDIFTLPSGYRPIATFVSTNAIGGTSSGRMDVNTAGQVKYNGSFTTPPSWVAVNIEFPVDLT